MLHLIYNIPTPAILALCAVVLFGFSAVIGAVRKPTQYGKQEQSKYEIVESLIK